MKKCLSLLLAALMLAAVLTGCGGNPSTEETDTLSLIHISEPTRH